jgi:uncharacterized protein YndB with AHSA1/START domain
MAVTLTTDDAPEAVWAVLMNGWRFADWVVGAKRIRAVDDGFPAPGTKLHHRFGVGPLVIDDTTVVEEIEEPRRLVLRARARPAGVARVELELEPTADGGTEIRMREDPTSGPAKVLDNPLLRRLVDARNLEALRRLTTLAGETRDAR